jgi:dGTPase
VPLVGPVVGEVRRRYPELERTRLIHEIVRRLINFLVNDVLEETRGRIAAAAPRSAAAVRALGTPLVGFSEPTDKGNRALRAFLTQRMYRHYRVNRMTSKARRVVRDLFALFDNEPECLPSEWRVAAEKADGDEAGRARIVADYIAGMTDRYALDEHRKLFDLDDQLR